MAPPARTDVPFSGATGWLSRRSAPVLLLSGGAGLALAGYALIRSTGTDPDSLLAYVGGALLLLGQLSAVVGLAILAWWLVSD
ncbi:hypothetical protein [Halorarum halobium]|uniref:hypothetical protein n=1 Tax=Halorarum halobium TaxID=3075121 RepID=UPI0028A5CB1C|nr:hypothetical protein [Halobaculum sp. XH14]